MTLSQLVHFVDCNSILTKVLVELKERNIKVMKSRRAGQVLLKLRSETEIFVKIRSVKFVHLDDGKFDVSLSPL